MAGCCWFPTDYQPDEYNEGQVLQTAWWHNMGNHYVPGELWDNILTVTPQALVSSFFKRSA